ncbi:MAG: response regulator [Bacteroidetes bacterium]|nr:response regulator [Bacteroidota bacterium]
MENNGNEFSLPKLIDLYGRKPLVLCVEDNMMNAELVAEYLKDYCRVDLSYTPYDALEKALISVYDLILMDINLGDSMTGIDVTHEIRRMHGYETIPVAAVTGFVLPSEKNAILETGVDYFLAKPYRKDELHSLITEIMLKLIYRSPGSLPHVPINAP